MKQFFGYEEIQDLIKTGSRVLRLPIGSSVRVGGQGFLADQDLYCNLDTTGIGGLDTGTVAANTLYNVFAVITSSSYGIVASTSSAPSGFLMYKFLGQLQTDGSSNIRFLITGDIVENGKFEYSQGAGDFTITSSGTGWSTVEAIAHVERYDDKYLLDFGIRGSLASATVYHELTFPGVTFRNPRAAVSAYMNGVSWVKGSIPDSNNTINLDAETAAGLNWYTTGRALITSKPSWVL